MSHFRGFILVITFAIFFSLFMAWGCSRKSTAPDETDKDVILSLITSYSDIFTSCVLDTIPDSSGMGRISAVIQDTLSFWWRGIRWGQTQRSIDIDIDPADRDHEYTYADVNVIDTLTGHLHLIRKDTLGTWSHVSKPLTDVAKRAAYFERRGPVNSLHRGWRLVKVSGLLIKSSPSTREILSVHLRSSKSNYDTTITLSYINECREFHDLLTFDEEDSVTLTAYTGDPTDSVYLHAYSSLFPHLFHVRQAFTNNGDGSFTGTWVTAELPLGASPYRHAAIDVLKHSTLDDEDPYDSKVWGVIYRIKEF